MHEAYSRQMGFRVAVLSAVILGILGGLVLTASADLHQLVHPDADDTGHECLVTILNSGLEPAIIVAPFVACLPVLIEPAREEIARLDCLFLACDTYKRGPPGAAIL
jgi:hypothetical protein